MRVAVLFLSTRRQEQLKLAAAALSDGLASQGHQVEVLDLLRDDVRLAKYEYVVVGSESKSPFSSKISEDFVKRLGQLGPTLPGKRASAFALGGGIGAQKALQRVMNAMESEGMFIRNSILLTKAEEARAFGASLEVSTKA